MLDEKVRKKRIKLYAYNINYSNSQRLKENLMSFKNLNKDFYEDIIKNDLDLIKSKKNLEVIKDDAIKESIYANKTVPEIWKNKLTYRQEVHNTITNDINFAKYIGGIKEEEKNDFNIEIPVDLKTYSQTTYHDNENDKNKIFSLNNTLNPSFEGNTSLNKSKDDNSHEKHQKKLNFFKTINQHINEKLIAIKLDEYKTKYNMNNFMREIKNNRKIQGKDKELLLKKPDFIKKRESNYRNYLKSIIQNEKVKVLKESIYVNLLPPKERMDEIDINKNKLKKLNLTVPKRIELLDSGSPEYDNLPKITNPLVRRDLELIDYYGPKYVHCKFCHRRNLEYYENLECNNCLKLTSYLKKVRLGDKDNDKN